MKHFVLAGRTGVGKSSFVNSTFGGQLAKVDPYEACTKLVTYYARGTEYGEVCLIDTPGLADEEDGRNDDAYLTMVQDRISSITLEAFIYVTPLKETRFRAEEENSLRKITTKLGPAIWSSSWLVFTFAASRPERERNETVDRFHREIHSVLSQIAKPNGFLGGFRGFRNVLLVDNVVSNWSPTCRPLASFLV